MATPRLDLDVYPTDADAFEAAAERVADHLRAAMARGRATVALSGGRGGRGVMVALAGRDDVPWERVDWYWADERCVPEDDPRSNQKLARDSLLEVRQVPEARIHAPSMALGDAERVAEAYAAALVADLGEPPVFDVVLLGLGPNAHIASLMPGGAALREQAPVVPVPVADVATDPVVPRITITPPVLRAARAVVLCATGADKAGAIARCLTGADDPVAVPGQLVRPSATVAWIIDRAAADDLIRNAQPG